MAEEKFKLPISSYEEICKIIQAYGKLNKPASLTEVTKSTRIHTTVISGNNAFLSAVGIIEGGNKKTATNKGRALAQAIEYNVPNAWRVIVEDNDFLNKMILAVRIRKGMETSSLEAHIAYSAGQRKTPKVMTGARTVIDILRSSGIVKEEDDRIVPLRKAVPAPEEKPVSPVTKVPAAEVLTPLGVSLRIEVRIDVKPPELEGLGEKLKVLIENLSEIRPKVEKAKENAEQK